jgi:quercetin dioxygenase-like cupin family protein
MEQNMNCISDDKSFRAVTPRLWRLCVALMGAAALFTSPGTAMAETDRADKREPMMQVTRNGSREWIKGPEDWFTGRAWIAPVMLENQPPSRVTSARVSFEPGARTNWHKHPLGQLMVVTSGRGWTQVKGGPRVEINTGDTVWCPPGKTHWHGAAATTGMTHLVVQEKLDGKNVEWLGPVSDEEYGN